MRSGIAMLLIGAIGGAAVGFVAGRALAPRAAFGSALAADPDLASSTTERAASPRAPFSPGSDLPGFVVARSSEARADQGDEPGSKERAAAPPDGSAAAPADPPAPPGAAVPATLREELLAATGAERARLLHELSARLAGLSAAERAKALHELFRNDGWFSEAAGPTLDRSLWDLAAATLRETESAALRSDLVSMLSEQLARSRGVDPFAAMIALAHVTLDGEMARLDSTGAEPPEDVLAAIRELIAAEGRIAEGGEPFSSDLLMKAQLGLGGAGARRDDRELLMRFAERAPLRKVRAASYVALGTTAADPAVDSFLSRQASSSGGEWPERLFAWIALRRRGREELVPASVRREILDAWGRSGVRRLEELFAE